MVKLRQQTTRTRSERGSADRRLLFLESHCVQLFGQLVFLYPGVNVRENTRLSPPFSTLFLTLSNFQLLLRLRAQAAAAAAAAAAAGGGGVADTHRNSVRSCRGVVTRCGDAEV